jgi:hypothetical protein
MPIQTRAPLISLPMNGSIGSNSSTSPTNIAM